MRRLKLELAAVYASALLSLAFPFLAVSAPDGALFGQLPQAHDAAISPEGDRIAVLQNVQGSYWVNIIDINPDGDGPTKQMMAGLGEDVQPQYVKWIDDHRVIVSVLQQHMFRNDPITSGFLHLVDTRTLKARPIITPPNYGLRQFNNQVLDWLEDDPEHIIMQFAGDGKDQNKPDVRRVNIENGRHNIIKRHISGVNHWVTDAEGEPRVGTGFRDRGNSAFITIQDPVTEDWEDADHYPGIDPETMYIIAVTDAGKNLVVSAYRGKDTRGLHRYDLVNKTWGEVIYRNDEYDVGNVILSKDGRDIVGASFTGETTERVLFDEYGSTYEEALAAFEGLDVQFIDQSEDSERLLVRLSAPSEPGGLYLYERGGKISLIAPNLDGLSMKDMGEVIALRYTSRDGEKIPAFVTLPASINDASKLKNVPTIILPHGGPYSRDTKQFDYLAQFFATRGYLVLQMNFRGSAGYGKAFADAGRSSWVVMQEDVEDGMRWLIEKGYADPAKSCIAGWSYGGYAALMGVVKNPQLYQCGIAIAALSDIPGAIADARNYYNGPARVKRTFGALIDDKDLMRENNPVDHADKIRVPIFLAHGELDKAVQIDQFNKMKRRLESAGVDGTYMRFEDEGHYMSNQANRQAMLAGIEAFLLRVNGESPFIVK